LSRLKGLVLGKAYVAAKVILWEHESLRKVVLDRVIIAKESTFISLGPLEDSSSSGLKALIREIEVRTSATFVRHIRSGGLIAASNCWVVGLLELLFSKELLPVSVLPLELLIGALHCGLLLGHFSQLVLQKCDLLLLLLATADCTLSILESLASLFVLGWIFGIGKGALLVRNLLLYVLTLLLGELFTCLVGVFEGCRVVFTGAFLVGHLLGRVGGLCLVLLILVLLGRADFLYSLFLVPLSLGCELLLTSISDLLKAIITDNNVRL
jgi:hypothetical protein